MWSSFFRNQGFISFGRGYRSCSLRQIQIQGTSLEKLDSVSKEARVMWGSKNFAAAAVDLYD